MRCGQDWPGDPFRVDRSAIPLPGRDGGTFGATSTGASMRRARCAERPFTRGARRRPATANFLATPCLLSAPEILPLFQPAAVESPRPGADLMLKGMAPIEGAVPAACRMGAAHNEG
jgi:hypothetical protein